jgi:hypothetical protein
MDFINRNESYSGVWESVDITFSSSSKGCSILVIGALLVRDDLYSES